MTFNDKIHKIQEHFFNVFIFISYTVIILSALGLSLRAPLYLDELEYYIRIYICIFLIWRFNPFRKIKFTDLDRKIAFSAGLFILTTTAIDKYLIDLLDKIKKNI